MRLDIRYRMTFGYGSPVREAHNEIRVRPRDLPSQRLLAYRLTVQPAARVLSFTDYWGTTVEHFGHVPDHDRLEIVAEAAVETRQAEPVGSAPMHALDAGFASAHDEYLRSSPHVVWDDALRERSTEAVRDAADVIAAAESVVDVTRTLLVYERDSTSIGVGLAELVAGGRGVCQDYAHLTIGMLRAVGIPARYVSGYLFAADDTGTGEPTGTAGADEAEDLVRVQTHAWVEVAIPDQGWWAVDPTNGRRVGERHVVVGYGRDYDDVAPVRGVYLGEAVPEVEAAVEIRRMEPMARAFSERPRRRRSDLADVPIADAAAAEQQQQQ